MNQDIAGLIKGVTYSIDFYQINTGLKSADNSVLYDDEGAFEVYIGGVLAYTSPSYPVQSGWVAHSFNFTANNSTEKIAFVAKHTNKGSSNSDGLYMGLDGVQFTPALSLDLVNLAIDNSTILWSTENENNFSHFEVERKKEEDKEFELLETVDSKFGADNDYSFEDNSHEEGEYLYRLKMINNGGKFYYSKLVAANYQENKKVLRVYPNPINPDSKIQLKGFENEGEVIIYNMIGEKLFFEQVDFSISQNLNYLLQDLSQGTYFISVRENNSAASKTFKFIVK